MGWGFPFEQGAEPLSLCSQAGSRRGGARAISRETEDQEDARRAGLLVQSWLRQRLLLPLQPPDGSSPNLRLVSR